MKKRKKIILIVILLLVVAGIIVGVITYRNNHSKAYVAPIEQINSTWMLSNGGTEGNISDAATQNIYLEEEDIVSQVFAAEGDVVAVGDPLFQYDTQALSLDVEARELEVEAQNNQLNIARQQLANYQKIVPVAENSQEGYTLSDTQKVPTAYKGDGSAADPFCFLCTGDTIITGREINQLIEDGHVGVFELREPKEATGTLIDSWTIDGNSFLRVDDWAFYQVSTRQQWEPPYSDEITYTQAEKDKLISGKQMEIKKLENSIKLSQNGANQSKQKLTDATVKATVPGIVKNIGDPQNPPKDGSAFLSITSEQGVSVVGYVSEMKLDETKVGDKITVMSYETGMSTEATITEISDYPAENYQTYSEGNNNVSYYAYSAFMEDDSGFKVGEYVNIQPFIENADQLICIEKIYVRTENGKSYVLKRGDNDRLVKQEVTIENTADSSYVVITDGLTLEDAIAFPYGNKAKEGIKTTDVAPLVLF